MDELHKKIAYLYYEKKMSTPEIAEEVGLHSSTIRRILNRKFKGVRSKSERYALITQKLKGRKHTKEKLANMRRGWIEKRPTPEYRKQLSERKQGEKHHQNKLTNQKVIEIRKKYDELLEEGFGKVESQRILAKRYGVKRPTISDVVLRRSWRHV